MESDLERLTALEQIRQLKARYVRCLDAGLWPELEALWAPDALLDIRGAGPTPDWNPAGCLSGRDVIMAALRSRPPGAGSVHSAFCPEFEWVSPREVTAVWPLEYRLWWASGSPFNTMHGHGHWLDSYVRLDHGWVIRTSRVTSTRVEVS